MARYHGKKGVVYISTSGTGAAAAAVAMTNWSLDMTTDKVDVTAMGDTNKQYVQGLADVKGSLSGWWDDTSDTLYDASRSSDGVKLYLYPSSDAVTKYFYGPAWVDFKTEVGSEAGAKVSGDFVANGAWGQY